MRRAPTTEAKYIWPTVTDNVWVHNSQILTVLNTPQESPRGLGLYFDAEVVRNTQFHELRDKLKGYFKHCYHVIGCL